jgi:GcrA cell cycle regulator
MTAPSSWTDDRVQTLARLWRDGLSASQIARALAGGISRNAVIGKAHRLGLNGRANPSPPDLRTSREPRRTIRRVAAPIPPRRRPLTAASAPLPTGGGVTVVDVRRGQCRWPIGDPLADGLSLCGCAVVRGAYCAAHAEIAYRPCAKKPPRDHLLKLAGLA